MTNPSILCPALFALPVIAPTHAGKLARARARVPRARRLGCPTPSRQRDAHSAVEFNNGQIPLRNQPDRNGIGLVSCELSSTMLVTGASQFYTSQPPNPQRHNVSRSIAETSHGRDEGGSKHRDSFEACFLRSIDGYCAGCIHRNILACFFVPEGDEVFEYGISIALAQHCAGIYDAARRATFYLTPSPPHPFRCGTLRL